MLVKTKVINVVLIL